MYKKLCIITLTFILFFMFYLECSSDYYFEDVNSYTGSPLVEKLIPANGEQNIISKPEIKIYYSNLYNIDLKSIKLFINYQDVTDKTLITSKYISYTPDKKFKRGIQVARLELCDSSQKDNKTNLEWFFTVGSPTFNHYYGLFFDNTNNPTSQCNYNDLYNLSRYSNKLSFLSISEIVKYDDTLLKQKNKSWNKLIESRDSHTVVNQFIPLSNFKFICKLKNKKVATLNLYNCDEPIFYNNMVDIDTMYKNLYYNDNDIIGQFRTDDNFSDLDYLKYSPYGDHFISLFELEKQLDDNGTHLVFDTYINALENGWHVAPIVSQYNQDSILKLNNNFRTIVLCENLTKNDILDALVNRRVYTSEDKNIKVDFTINREPMGTIIENPNNLRFIVSAIDNDLDEKIMKIQVFSNNNKFIKGKTFNSNYAKLDFSLNNTKDSYYYAIITQKNNKKTITAPIWIENKNLPK